MELNVELFYIKYHLLIQNASKTYLPMFETIKYWYENTNMHHFIVFNYCTLTLVHKCLIR